MPFCLVQIQQDANLPVKRRVQTGETLRQILMYGAFADAEFRGGAADSRPVFQNVYGQIAGPFLDIGMQSHHSPVRGGFAARLLLHLYERERDIINTVMK